MPYIPGGVHYVILRIWLTLSLVVLEVNTQRLTEWIFYMMLYFQDGVHDVPTRQPNIVTLLAPYMCFTS